MNGRLLLVPLALLLPLAPLDARRPRHAPAAVSEHALSSGVQRSVTIEQRVIVRIGPSAPRRAMPAMLSSAPPPGRFKEKKLKGCVPIAGIAALLPYNGNRLLLYMRDRHMVSAALEKSCHVEEFYSGAYIARSEDGQLCARRERLQSRTGASCEVARLNRLEARR